VAWTSPLGTPYGAVHENTVRDGRATNWLCFAFFPLSSDFCLLYSAVRIGFVFQTPKILVFAILCCYQRAYINLGFAQIGFVFNFFLCFLSPVFCLLWLKLALFCIILTADFAVYMDLNYFELFNRGRHGHGQPRAMPWANRFLSTPFLLRYS